MKMMTKKIADELVRRDKLVVETGSCDTDTVVKYFAPWSAATWEIYSATPLDANGKPDYSDPVNAPDWHMFGRCDLFGNGGELGYVLLSLLAECSGPAGLRIERELYTGFSK